MRDFNPKTDRGKQLYEMQTVEQGDSLATVVVPTDAPYEVAAMTPWYYLVEDADEQEPVPA
jgi:hypothetical protein